MTPQIDWNRTEAEARNMPRKELNGRIQTILRMLPILDEMDRTHGTDMAGYYRDVISVYRKEAEGRVVSV